jgi:hypothetical protein
MPIYELTLTQTFENQVCINRWNYLMTGTPAAVSGSFALVSAAGAIYDEVHVPPQYPTGTLMDYIHAMQSTLVQYQEITCFNPYDPVDFYQTPFVPPYTGGFSGEANSPVLAIGFRSNVVRRDIRRATKRFVGVGEAFPGNGGSLDTSNSILVNLEHKMSDTLTYDDEGNTLNFIPCVVGKEKYQTNTGHPTNEADRFAYKYYATEAEQLEHIAQGITWEVYDHVRTQVSRQYGRGR